MICKQAAEHQRAEFAAQTERFETESPRDRETDAEQQQQFLVAGEVEQPVDEAPRREEPEQRERPRRWRRALSDTEHRDGGEILHDEDPDRDLAVESAKLAFLLERFRHNHGA